MREIKFRGKRVDDGKWVYGYLSKGRLQGFKENSLQPCIDREENGVMVSSVVMPSTVGQYTELKDKNGVEIWEGDIVRTKYANARTNEFTELVVYRNGKFMAERKFGTASTAWALLSDGVMHIAADKSVYMQEIEVIGNVFDSPDLLNT